MNTSQRQLEAVVAARINQMQLELEVLDSVRSDLSKALYKINNRILILCRNIAAEKESVIKGNLNDFQSTTSI